MLRGKGRPTLRKLAFRRRRSLIRVRVAADEQPGGEDASDVHSDAAALALFEARLPCLREQVPAARQQRRVKLLAGALLTSRRIRWHPDGPLGYNSSRAKPRNRAVLTHCAELCQAAAVQRTAQCDDLIHPAAWGAAPVDRIVVGVMHPQAMRLSMPKRAALSRNESRAPSAV